MLGNPTPMDTDARKLQREMPDCLVDSCKHSGVKRMTAGLGTAMDLLSTFFKHTLCNIITRAVGPRPIGDPTDLQYSCSCVNCKALINKINFITV